MTSNFSYFSNTSFTLPVESSHNYEQIALSPDGNLLFAVNEGIVNIFKNIKK